MIDASECCLYMDLLGDESAIDWVSEIVNASTGLRFENEFLLVAYLFKR